MTPAERHAAVLAGLDRLAALDAAATPDRWLEVDLRRVLVGHRDGSPLAAPPVLARADDAALVLTLRNAAAAVIAGRRRIIERHGPDPDGDHRFCSRCVAEAPRGPVPVPWPCDDWRDAAADLLPAADDAIVAWLHRHGLTTSAGPGAVLAAVRADLNPAAA